MILLLLAVEQVEGEEFGGIKGCIDKKIITKVWGIIMWVHIGKQEDKQTKGKPQTQSHLEGVCQSESELC